MNFPSADKFRRAKLIAKKRKIDEDNLLAIAEIYEKDLGGSVTGKDHYIKEDASKKELKWLKGDEEETSDLTVKELKEKLREQDKKVSGTKDELIERLND